MKKKKDRRTKQRELALLLLALFLVLFCYHLLVPAHEVWLTNHISLDSREDIWLLTMVKFLGIILIYAVLRFTIAVCFWVLRQPRPFIYFGLFMVLLGAGGLLAFFLNTPSDQLKNNIHVAIVGLLLAGIGGLMLFKSWRK